MPSRFVSPACSAQFPLFPGHCHTARQFVIQRKRSRQIRAGTGLLRIMCCLSWPFAYLSGMSLVARKTCQRSFTLISSSLTVRVRCCAHEPAIHSCAANPNAARPSRPRRSGSQNTILETESRSCSTSSSRMSSDIAIATHKPKHRPTVICGISALIAFAHISQSRDDTLLQIIRVHSATDDSRVLCGVGICQLAQGCLFTSFTHG